MESLVDQNFETDGGIDFSDNLEDEISDEKREDFKSPGKNDEPANMLNFDKK